jgi:hypothetical protein
VLSNLFDYSLLNISCTQSRADEYN